MHKRGRWDLQVQTHRRPLLLRPLSRFTLAQPCLCSKFNNWSWFLAGKRPTLSFRGLWERRWVLVSMCWNEYTEVCSEWHSNTGVVNSPNYPDNYANNLQRIQTIQVEKGLILSIQFLAFDIESSTICGDQLTIVDGEDTAMMNKSCGSTSSGNVEVGDVKIGSLLPANITSTSNTVRLVFKTDNESKYARAGWSISWRAVEQGKSWLLINYH